MRDVLSGLIEKLPLVGVDDSTIWWHTEDYLVVRVTEVFSW